MAIPFKRLRAWTDSASVAAPGFAGVSYALFCLDRHGDGTGGSRAGRILAARSPNRALWQPGAPLPDLADLTPMAYHYLVTGTITNDFALSETPASSEPGSLFVWTRTGLGLLSRRHALTADIGLFLHIHTDPLSAARLLSSGAFAGEKTVSGGFALSPRIRAVSGRPTRRDMPAFTCLNDTRATLASIAGGFQPSVLAASLPGEPAAVPLSAVFAMAAFAGCALSVELDGRRIAPDISLAATLDSLSIPEPEHDYIACHSPQVLELLLLGLFSEVRAYSRDRSASCRITSGRLWAAPSLTIDYTPAATLSPPDIEALLALRTHLSRVAAFHGMELSLPPVSLRPSAATLPPQTLSLDWLADPALLPTGDLKSHLSLSDDRDDSRT